MHKNFIIRNISGRKSYKNQVIIRQLKYKWPLVLEKMLHRLNDKETKFERQVSSPVKIIGMVASAVA